MKISLRFKLVLSYLLLIGLFALASGYLFFSHFAREYENQLMVNLFTQGSIAAGSVREFLDRPALVVDNVKELSRQFNLRILVINQDSMVIIDSQYGHAEELTGKHVRHTEVLKALGGESSANIYSVAGYGEVMYAAVPIVKEKQVVGSVFLSKSLREFTLIKQEIINRILLSTGLGSLLTIIFSLFLAGYFSRPLKQLTEAAVKLAGGDLSYRVGYASRDEFGQLASTFNKMAEEIESQDTLKRRFIADASHEIRTPLSTVKMLTQTLQHSSHLNKAQIGELLADMEMEVDRLSDLVNNLLELTRIEAQKDMSTDLEEVQLSHMVKKIVRRFEPVAEARGISLRLIAEDVEVESHYNSLFRIVQNLIDNALKYTPKGGEVEISLQQLKDKALIKIKDTGIGIKPEDLQNIFGRFYRVDPARTGSQGGFGLGLSLAKELCQKLNIHIGVESEFGKGTAFSLHIPKSKNLIFL